MNQKILFTASPQILSKLIRWFIDSPVSHVFIEFDLGTDFTWALEATVGGVRIVPANRAKHNIKYEK